MFVAVVAVLAVFAVMLVLHPKPVFVVQINAELAELHPPIASAVTFAVPLVALPSTVFVAICATLARVIPFVALWNAYVPAPVLVKNPVEANPVILSSAVPLADAAFVPPFAIGKVPVA